MAIPNDVFWVGMRNIRPRPLTTWLRQAGLIDGARQGRGTPSTAADGHPTRSILEREIDDWMSANDIAHELEPAYPYDHELNPNGSRADWLLADGTFVEATGLLGVPAYETKIQRKIELVQRHGITLVLLGPGDLGNLEQLLGPHRTSP